MGIYLGIDPGTFTNQTTAKHGISLFCSDENSVISASTCIGFPDLESYINKYLDQYSISMCGIETCSHGGGWGNVRTRCEVHETIGAIKMILRPYFMYVADIPAHKVAKISAVKKENRIEWCKINFKNIAFCDEHIADSSIVAYLTSLHREVSIRKMIKY